MGVLDLEQFVTFVAMWWGHFKKQFFLHFTQCKRRVSFTNDIIEKSNLLNPFPLPLVTEL